MSRRNIQWKPKGMNRDLSVSAFNSEFIFENHNLRLSTFDHNTQMSWVNEKGTLPVTLYLKGNSEEAFTIEGVVIGTAVLNSKLVLFVCNPKTEENKDRIYVLEFQEGYQDKMDVTLLYQGTLGFDIEHPLETLVSYETEEIQKVYWTDGLNSPRVINIAVDKAYETDVDGYNPFDFVPQLALKETVQVKKLLGANGSFPPGVIQYAFTYYTKNGQESCIFYTTPLQYISYGDRGASPEDTTVENAFQITLKNLDTHFDYVRIYSIQRTSINNTAITKRVQDLALDHLEEDNNQIVFTDTGRMGESVDPTSLLYKGGESITAETMDQKDGTLFFGNIQIQRPQEENVKDALKDKVAISSSTRTIYCNKSQSTDYVYSNQLTSFKDKEKTENIPCGGFKAGDIYRLGVQFQYKTGKWGQPYWIGDYEEKNHPNIVIETDSNQSYQSIHLPTFIGQLDEDTAQDLIKKDYVKVRPIVVFPNVYDRRVLCQGVTCPTLYTNNHRNTDKDMYAQSSWFFRTYGGLNYKDAIGTIVDNAGAVYPIMPDSTSIDANSGMNFLAYTKRDTGDKNIEGWNPNQEPRNIRQVEIQGNYDADNQFKLDPYFVTFHSPDVEYQDLFPLQEFDNTTYRQIAAIPMSKTFSDINIQTETPTISSSGSGFVHKSFVGDTMHGIVSGLFYDDYAVDDSGDNDFEIWTKEHSAFKWMVYLWNRSGSLNNDINRPANKGVQSAKLKTKVISNLRIGTSSYAYLEEPKEKNFKHMPQLYIEEGTSILKFDSNLYMGNIDTMLIPDHKEGLYFAFSNSSEEQLENTDIKANESEGSFTGPIYWKTYAKNFDDEKYTDYGVWHYNKDIETTTDDFTGKTTTTESQYYWRSTNNNLGQGYAEIIIDRTPVRMRYKSGSHLVFETSSVLSNDITTDSGYKYNTIPLVEILRPDTDTRFGGDSEDALRENNWIPCGEPVRLDQLTTPTLIATNTEGQTEEKKVVEIHYDYGDTYFQRWDCLKTYPYNREDINQVVEIGSFMVESHLNLDGRYDRNRGQLSNINMSPQNFGLLNYVYTQTDNFFTYKIQDDSYYKKQYYPNQITWSLTKTNGADIDLWTNMTLGSVQELDGDKGEIRKIIRYNDQLLVFQDQGVSQLLYNENVQISATNGTPIEIANSGKVQGVRYLSNNMGCSNKWSIVKTPAGLYFIDSLNKGIYLYNGSFSSLSLAKGFDSWCKQTIPSKEVPWTPQDFKNYISYYDKQNQDILYINEDTALAYSEKFNAFTSFYDYGHTPYFIALDDKGLWVRVEDNQSTLHLHQAGIYCTIFGENKPYSMTLVANQEPQVDKIFTNLEYRACVDNDGVDSVSYFSSYLPFASIEVWDEYQHGIMNLAEEGGTKKEKDYQHHEGDDEILKRRFRIWRQDIPRDNAPLDSDAGKNIFRTKVQPMNRMRNPWLYLKLENAKETVHRVEIHDIAVGYY